MADGGILVFAIEPASGKIRWVKRLNTVPQKQFYGDHRREFDNFDLLHGEGDCVAISRWLFDCATGRITADAKRGLAHLTTGGSGVMVPQGAWSYAPRQQMQARTPEHQVSPCPRPLVVFRDNVLYSCSEDKRTVYRRDFNPAGGGQFDTAWHQNIWNLWGTKSRSSGEASGWPAVRNGRSRCFLTRRPVSGSRCGPTPRAGDMKRLLSSAFVFALLGVLAGQAFGALIDARNPAPESGGVWTVAPGDLFSISALVSGGEEARGAQLSLEVRELGGTTPLGPSILSIDMTSSGLVFDGAISSSTSYDKPQQRTGAANYLDSSTVLTGTLATVEFSAVGVSPGTYDLSISAGDSNYPMLPTTFVPLAGGDPISITTPAEFPTDIIARIDVIPEPTSIVQLLGLAGTGGLFAGSRTGSTPTLFRMAWKAEENLASRSMST